MTAFPTKQYQSLIGALQWTISLGRLDITTAVMSLSSFRSSPRKGHMERVTRIYGYLSKMRHATIRIRIGEPDFSDIPEQDYGNILFMGTLRKLFQMTFPGTSPTFSALILNVFKARLISPWTRPVLLMKHGMSYVAAPLLAKSSSRSSGDMSRLSRLTHAWECNSSGHLTWRSNCLFELGNRSRLSQ